MPKPLYPWSEVAAVKIVSAIRHGAYPFIAAESAGIPREVFTDWMRRGSAKRPLPHFRRFRDQVREGIATARLAAEMKALKDDPLFWLKYGPGRETADVPGWSNAVKPPAGDEAGPEATESEIRLGLLAALAPEMNRLPPVLREAILAVLGSEMITPSPPTTPQSSPA
jgi:hypothetical protein